MNKKQKKQSKEKKRKQRVKKKLREKRENERYQTRLKYELDQFKKKQEPKLKPIKYDKESDS